MEKYIINGVEVEYDTFDLDNMERLEEAVNHVQDEVNALQQKAKSGEPAMKLLREQANVFLDFFDDVLGDGTARKIFGDRVNIRDIAAGYREFTEAVGGQQGALREAIGGARPNREQRRAAERQRRRVQPAEMPTY